MNCQQIDDLLPWFLNGTLSDDEVRVVEEHLESCESCRRGLGDTAYVGNLFALEPWPQGLTGQGAAVPAEHPTAQELVGFAFGDALGDETRVRVERHVEGCPECREQLSMTTESREALGGSHRSENSLSEPPLAFRPAAGRTEKPIAGSIAESPSTVHRGWRWAALAASLIGAVALVAGLIATGNLSSRSASQQAQLNDFERRVVELSALNERLEAAAQETGPTSGETPVQDPRSEPSAKPAEPSAVESQLRLAESRIAELEGALGAPRLNTAIVDLFADDAVLRGEQSPLAGSISDDSEWVTLILNPPADLGDEVEVRLLDAGGDEIWRRSGLRLDDNGGYVLTLPVAMLPASGGAFVIDSAGGDSGTEGVRSVRFPLVR